MHISHNFPSSSFTVTNTFQSHSDPVQPTNSPITVNNWLHRIITAYRNYVTFKTYWLLYVPSGWLPTQRTYVFQNKQWLSPQMYRYYVFCEVWTKSLHTMLFRFLFREVNIIHLSITNKMQRYTTFFIAVNVLHVSGGFSAHHQELKLYIHHVVCVRLACCYR